MEKIPLRLHTSYQDPVSCWIQKGSSCGSFNFLHHFAIWSILTVLSVIFSSRYTCPISLIQRNSLYQPCRETKQKRQIASSHSAWVCKSFASWGFYRSNPLYFSHVRVCIYIYIYFYFFTFSETKLQKVLLRFWIDENIF